MHLLSAITSSRESNVVHTLLLYAQSQSSHLAPTFANRKIRKSLSLKLSLTLSNPSFRDGLDGSSKIISRLSRRDVVDLPYCIFFPSAIPWSLDVAIVVGCKDDDKCGMPARHFSCRR